MPWGVGLEQQQAHRELTSFDMGYAHIRLGQHVSHYKDSSIPRKDTQESGAHWEGATSQL